MKAVVIDEERNLVWSEVPDPFCHDEFDVKLKVEACALNRADLMQRQDIYAPPEGWPLQHVDEHRYDDDPHHSVNMSLLGSFQNPRHDILF